LNALSVSSVLDAGITSFNDLAKGVQQFGVVNDSTTEFFLRDNPITNYRVRCLVRCGVVWLRRCASAALPHRSGHAHLYSYLSRLPAPPHPRPHIRSAW